jgi:hypothetical protein
MHASHIARSFICEFHRQLRFSDKLAGSMLLPCCYGNDIFENKFCQVEKNARSARIRLYIGDVWQIK